MFDQGRQYIYPGPFITEKTAKAFALGQIPLILGPRRQVTLTKELGFDLFEDIIDVSYDSELDPNLRIKLFTNSLKKFIDSNPVETLQDLKTKLMPRFTKNHQLAQQFCYNTITEEIKQTLKRL